MAIRLTRCEIGLLALNRRNPWAHQRSTAKARPRQKTKTTTSKFMFPVRTKRMAALSICRLKMFGKDRPAISCG